MTDTDEYVDRFLRVRPNIVGFNIDNLIAESYTTTESKHSKLALLLALVAVVGISVPNKTFDTPIPQYF